MIVLDEELQILRDFHAQLKQEAINRRMQELDKKKQEAKLAQQRELMRQQMELDKKNQRLGLRKAPALQSGIQDIPLSELKKPMLTQAKSTKANFIKG